jgi:hypothetical protein
VQIELDIFSGRPNPTWELDDSEVDQLLGLMAQRSQEAGRGFDIGGLGYRGFILTVTGQQSGMFDQAHVFRGVIKLTLGASVTYVRDHDREVEYWLLDTAKRHVSEELYDKTRSMMR